MKCGRNGKLCSEKCVICMLHSTLNTFVLLKVHELKNLMYRRDRLKIKASQTGDPNDWNNFKKLRNEVNNAIENAKKSYSL